MVSRAEFRQFTLFIKPDTGPITPVVIEGALVDAGGLRQADGDVDEVVKQIRQLGKDGRFAQLALDSPMARNNIRATLRHTRVIHNVTGVGVYIPGVIAGGAAVDAADDVRLVTEEWQKRLSEAEKQRKRDVDNAYDRGRQDEKANAQSRPEDAQRIAELERLYDTVRDDRDRQTAQKKVAEGTLTAEQAAHQRTRDDAAREIARLNGLLTTAQFETDRLKRELVASQEASQRPNQQMGLLNAQMSVLTGENQTLREQNARLEEKVRSQQLRLDAQQAGSAVGGPGPHPPYPERDPLAL